MILTASCFHFQDPRRDSTKARSVGEVKAKEKFLDSCFSDDDGAALWAVYIGAKIVQASNCAVDQETWLNTDWNWLNCFRHDL